VRKIFFRTRKGAKYIWLRHIRVCGADNYKIGDIVKEERPPHQTTNLTLSPTEMIVSLSMDTSGWYPVILHFIIVDLALVQLENMAAKED
jgi:hypothetical protein